MCCDTYSHLATVTVLPSTTPPPDMKHINQRHGLLLTDSIGNRVPFNQRMDFRGLTSDFTVKLTQLYYDNCICFNWGDGNVLFLLLFQLNPL